MWSLYRSQAAVDQQGLVERARGGDHDAFALLVGASVAKLDSLAWLIVRDRELAHDAVQDTLFRAWRDLPGLRDPARFDAWLHRILVNTCLGALRRRRRRPIEVDLQPVMPAGGADPLASIADRDEIERAFERIDAGHRAVVVLHFYLGMPLPDVASVMGIPLGTAKSRLHRALAAMRVVTAENAGTNRIQEGHVA
jgi:RNA polymerase sigma-70 factor (ECF subfamily)